MAEYNPAEPVTITLTWEQWERVARFLEDCRCDRLARMYTWLAYHDKKTGAKEAAAHERMAALAETLRKSIDAALYPAPPKETE